MIKSIWVLFFLLFETYFIGQYEAFPRTIDSLKYQSIEAKLLTEFGQNKVIPKGFQLQTLIALSRYPELRDVKIKFRSKRIKTTMACRPGTFFLLRQRSKRSYNIFINNHSMEIEHVWLKNLSFNAQVGVIAHELAHIIDYMNRSNLQIAVVGFKYGSKSWRSQFEKSIDSIAISRGFAWQLYEFSYFIQNSANIPQEYKDYKKETYYSPDYIFFKINETIFKEWLLYLNFVFPK